MKLLFILALASLPALATEPADCRAVAQKLQPWAEGDLEAYGQELREAALTGVPEILFTRPKLAQPWDGVSPLSPGYVETDPWDWRWVTDVAARNSALSKHRILWQATQEAKRGLQVPQNLAIINSFIAEEPLGGMAVQALGEIGDPASTDTLIALVKTIVENGTPTDAAFWAPTALGGLRFGKADTLLRAKAEAALFNLLKVPGHAEDFNGLALMDSPAATAMYVQDLYNSDLRWQASRALVTRGDLASFDEFRKLMNTNNEAYLESLRMLRYYLPKLSGWHVDTQKLFTEIATRYLAQYYDAPTSALTSHPATLGGVLSFMPPECHW